MAEGVGGIGSGGSAPVKEKTSSPKAAAPAKGSSGGAKAKSKAKTPSATSTKDKVGVSKDAKKADKPNAMADGITNNWKSQGLETSDGNKLGQYKKGGEGTVEKELLKKGFTLKDIYTKDKQGHTLADQVAQANGIKDQKKIADGKELKLPQRPGAQGLSSGEVKEGEKKSIETVNGANKAQASIEKGPDGVKAEQKTSAGTNSVEVDHKTAPGGTVHVSTAKKGDEVQNNALIQSPNNQAITESTQRTGNGDVHTTLRDADKNKNSTVKVEDDKLKMNNPDGATSGNDSAINLGPQSLSEKAGRWVDNLAPSWTGAQRVTAPEGPVGGISQVDGVQHTDGSAHYNLRQGNGQTQSVDQTARGTFQNVGKGLSDRLDSIGETLSNGFSKLFGGGGNPTGGGIPAEQIFSPSGTII